RPLGQSLSICAARRRQSSDHLVFVRRRRAAGRQRLRRRRWPDPQSMIHARGYTLLEMVVVVALLALTTAMVAPAGLRMIQSWRDADDVKRVLGKVAALPVSARDRGREWRLPPEDEAAVAEAVALPEGWRLVLHE